MRARRTIVSEDAEAGLRITESGFIEVSYGDDMIGVEPTPATAREMSKILLVLADFQEGKLSASEFVAYLKSRAGGGDA